MPRMHGTVQWHERTTLSASYSNDVTQVVHIFSNIKFSLTIHNVHHVPEPLQPFKKKCLLFICIMYIYFKKFLQFTKQAWTLDKYHTPVQLTLSSVLQRSVGTQPSTIGRAGQGTWMTLLFGSHCTAVQTWFIAQWVGNRRKLAASSLPLLSI
jgi:hypothetical protein